MAIYKNNDETDLANYRPISVLQSQFFQNFGNNCL